MKKFLKKSSILLLALALIAVTDDYVHSTSLKHANLAELTNLAELIFVGKVIGMSDGLGENNLPYTEFTFEISQSIKGDLSEGSTFSYRQIGLLRPRDMGDGIALAAKFEGFPHYKEGETAMVFLYKAAALTGLRTTVGLFQGKFVIEGGKIVNGNNNLNLFSGMKVNRAALVDKEVGMLSQKSGPVDADTFINLVSRAVKEGLFE
ncbi:MAG: hypothetical protein ACREQA_21880 [Candidatus Binatia bacterium]